jgi:hypothetical protein
MSPTVVGQVVQLSFSAPQASWQGLFDRLEVWRAPSVDGPYVELTAPVWTGARIPGDLLGSPPLSPPTGPGVILVGKKLSVLINEQTQVDVTFTGTDPLTYSVASSQITAQGEGIISSFIAADGRVVIQTFAPGNSTILRVLPTDAAALLGLPTTEPACVNYGKDARLQLVQGVDAYSFTDAHGDPSYFYKARLDNSFNGNLSAFSTPFPAQTTGVLDGSALILGTVDIVDMQGRPVQNREVSLFTKFTGLVAGGFVVTPTDLRKLTDSNGHVEFPLLRGTTVVVSVAGTQLQRDVTVPTDPTLTSFNLLDPTVGTDDVFTVQVPDIDFAVRRAL